MIKNDSRDVSYRQFVKPRLAESLAVMGLDVTYHRAQGNHVYATDESGKEIEILDMVGGNGSLLFGHNHPRVIAELREALGGGMLVHGQLSIRREAGLLAETLSKIARRDTRIDEDFIVHFANSGAEAIECALKHAEVTRLAKLMAVWDAVRPGLEALQRSARAGEVAVPVGQLEDASIAARFGRVRSLEALVDRVIAHNRAQLVRRPLFVALEQAFHGPLDRGDAQRSRQKLVDAGSLTEFAEVEVAEITERFGNIAHRLSTYDKRGTLNGQAFEGAGVISTQLIHTPAGWKISSMVWDDERPGLVIPAHYRG